MKTTPQSTTMSYDLNHDALLSRIKDSVTNREINHPFKQVAFPLFSSVDELEAIADYNEEFLFRLAQRSGISNLQFKTIGLLWLSQDFLKLGDLSRVSFESDGHFFSEKDFFSDWWDTFNYSSKNGKECRERASGLVLYFDKSNNEHKETFRELSGIFDHSNDDALEQFPFKKFSSVILPSKILSCLSW